MRIRVSSLFVLLLALVASSPGPLTAQSGSTHEPLHGSLVL
jgi:hypothetical protein